jgi:hypothetical protein
MIALAEIRAKLLGEMKTVEVPEWGLVGEKALRVGPISAADYYRIRERAKEAGEMPQEDDDPAAVAYFVEMIAACATDAAGDRAFDNEEGREFLRLAHLAPITRLAIACLEVNGLGEEKAG